MKPKVTSIVTNKLCPIREISSGNDGYGNPDPDNAIYWCPDCGRLIQYKIIFTPEEYDTSLDCIIEEEE